MYKNTQVHTQLANGTNLELVNHTQPLSDTKGGCSAKIWPVSVSDFSFFIRTMKGLTSRKFQGASSYWYSDCQLPRETKCPHLRTPWEVVSSYENPIHFLQKKVLILLWPNRPAWLYHERSKSSTKCCSLKMSSRAPRSKAIPFFLGSSRPLLGSWQRSKFTSPFVGSEHKFGSLSSCLHSSPTEKFSFG